MQAFRHGYITDLDELRKLVVIYHNRFGLVAKLLAMPGAEIIKYDEESGCTHLAFAPGYIRHASELLQPGPALHPTVVPDVA